MFINKIRSKESGILIYGITPPKVHTPIDKIAVIAQKTMSNLSSQDIDALIVYDVQDESARTTEERPFPFINALDPFDYASQYLHPLHVPKIIYRPAGMFSKEELKQWLHGLSVHGFYPVFVGLPSPDSVPKTSLKEAYEIFCQEHSQTSVMGAVTIPERHFALKDEDTRILDKVSCGVSYFISQCVFNVDYAKQMLADLADTCGKKQHDLPTIIFTLTICGSAKTLQFMEWLGIYMPETIKEELKASENAVVRSVEIATSIAQQLIEYCTMKGIPFGFNIESVAIRKEEVDASLDLLNTVRTLLVDAGLRKQPVSADSNTLTIQAKAS